MKKNLSLFCVIAVVLALLAGCGAAETSGNDATGGFDPARLKTVGDVYTLIGENNDNSQEGYSETKYVCVFSADGVYYRVYADLTKDVSEAVWAIEFDDEARDRKIRDLLSPLTLVSVENLSEQIPPQAELDKLAGKTGKELFDDGWTYWYYNLDDMEAGLNHDAFSYSVRFAYAGEPMENSDDFDFYEAFKDLKVTSVKWEGLGDATVLEE